MKQKTFFIVALLIATMTLTFSSCKEDKELMKANNNQTNQYSLKRLENSPIIFDTLEVLHKANRIEEEYNIDLNSFVQEIYFQNLVAAINEQFLCFNNYLQTLSPNEIQEVLNNIEFNDMINQFSIAMENEDYDLAASIIAPLSSLFKCDGSLVAEDFQDVNSEVNNRIVYTQTVIKESMTELSESYGISHIGEEELEFILSTAFEYSGMQYGNQENQNIFFAPPGANPNTHDVMMKDSAYKKCYNTAGAVFSAGLAVLSTKLAINSAKCGFQIVPALIARCLAMEVMWYGLDVISAGITYNVAVNLCAKDYQLNH
ncbi:MAG: hypothetical protein ACK5MH_00965 [Bacteroidales bacterium]